MTKDLGNVAKDFEIEIFLGWQTYRNGDFVNAKIWFLKAIKAENANALFGMASVLYVEKNYIESLLYFKLAAEKGCYRAFHWIGYFYHKGLGVPVDLSIASEFYKKGMERDFLIAEHAYIHIVFQTSGIFNKIRIFPKFIYLIFKTVFISVNRCDPRFYDFITLGPSINYKNK